ncbi:MAG: hypothetical protein HRT91_04230 [Piscirickettsiaceae bacterium]|nr:hypothetical protein [Piscirickettsiaceae bacterium]
MGLNTKVLTSNLTLQYHFLTNSNICLYIGAGINYTHIFKEYMLVDSKDFKPF